MNRELDPVVVAARLVELARLYVPESIEDGRMRHERPPVDVPFAVAVQRRLDELRALYELASHLHRRQLCP